MRLLIDRPQMIDTAYDGHAVVGNDVFGLADPELRHEPREGPGSRPGEKSLA